jgi:hypothetical protein
VVAALIAYIFKEKLPSLNIRVKELERLPALGQLCRTHVKHIKRRMQDTALWMYLDEGASASIRLFVDVNLTVGDHTSNPGARAKRREAGRERQRLTEATIRNLGIEVSEL